MMNDDSNQPLDATAFQTFKGERWRAIFNGILETARTTFLVLIAVRVYECGPSQKALIQGLASIGLLCSIFAVPAVAKSTLAPHQAASRLSFISALGFLLAACFRDSLTMFILGTGIAMVSFHSAAPLLAHVYKANYPERQRGRLFSITVVIKMGAAALFSQLSGYLLNQNLSWFSIILLGFSGAAMMNALLLRGYPLNPSPLKKGGRFWHAFRWLKKDPTFRRIIIAWMALGFGSLMCIALFVEYLANEKHGLALSESTIALVTGVIPSVSRMAATFFWGKLFDRMNFFVLRLIINLFFAMGWTIYFHSTEVIWLCLGTFIYGTALGGGEVTWNLWTTKLAPPENVAEYASVHTFTTGIRGVCAPFVGFYLAEVMPLGNIALIGTGLILISCVLLIPDIVRSRRTANG